MPSCILPRGLVSIDNRLLRPRNHRDNHPAALRLKLIPQSLADASYGWPFNSPFALEILEHLGCFPGAGYDPAQLCCVPGLSDLFVEEARFKGRTTSDAKKEDCRLPCIDETWWTNAFWRNGDAFRLWSALKQAGTLAWTTFPKEKVKIIDVTWQDGLEGNILLTLFNIHHFHFHHSIVLM